MTMRTWTRFAVMNSIREFAKIGTAKDLLYRGYKSEKTCEVKLIEDPRGYFLGWIPTGREEIFMVLHKSIFDIQFVGGHKAEVEKGNGIAVKLRLERI